MQAVPDRARPIDPNERTEMKKPSFAPEASPHPEAATTPSQQVSVPGIIMDFLERATVGVAGTRDENLVPHLHRVSGWKVEPDCHAMTCLVPDAFSKHMMSSLEDNGHFTVTIEEIGPHETYQFKGRYVSSRTCDEEDLLLHRQLRDRFGKVVSAKFGFAEDACRAFVLEPSIAVTFEVDEIFLQTPGPGAGRRLAPPEEK
jgi:hypothetical protein